MHGLRDAKGAPGIKFVVSYGYSVAYATEAVLLPLKAVCRTSAHSGFGFARGGRLHRGEQECNAEVGLVAGRSGAAPFSACRAALATFDFPIAITFLSEPIDGELDLIPPMKKSTTNGSGVISRKTRLRNLMPNAVFGAGPRAGAPGPAAPAPRRGPSSSETRTRSRETFRDGARYSHLFSTRSHSANPSRGRWCVLVPLERPGVPRACSGQ